MNKEKLEIRKLKASDKEAFLSFVKLWQEEDNPFLRRLVATFKEIDFDHFDAYLSELDKAENVADDENSLSSVYFAFMGESIVGRIACRWEIWKGNLIELAGNVGYSVVKEYRGQAIAESMIAYVLPKFAERKIERILISARVDNISSIRVLEKMGAELENQVEIDGKKFARYWLKTKNEND